MTDGANLARSRALAAGTAIFVALAIAAVVGPWITSLSPDSQVDPARAGLLPPGTRLQVLQQEDGSTLSAERIERVPGGFLLTRGTETTESRCPEPCRAEVRALRFPLGTDKFGRDVLARLFAGGRASLTLGLAAALLAFVAGTGIGAATAMLPPRWDAVVVVAIDGFRAFPRVFLLLALAAVAGPGIGAVVAVIAATGWMTVARLVRAEVRSLKERDFALAARASGAGPARLLLRHLMPNALGPALVETALGVGQAILLESTLSFLGLGVPPPTASWGSMIADGRDALANAWWVSVTPGVALAATLLAASLVADGLRDRFDPRYRAVGW